MTKTIIILHYDVTFAHYTATCTIDFTASKQTETNWTGPAQRQTLHFNTQLANRTLQLLARNP